MILHNKAQCSNCKDVIESVHRHDFKCCSCGAMCVDGGKDYVRRVGNLKSIIELTEYSMPIRLTPNQTRD